jgi:hypothetical protein
MMTKPRKILSLAMAVIPSLAFFSLRAQAQDLPVGKIIERVVCLKDDSQSYALYLPPNYTTDRRWPVIYAFDPAARGLRPVERFKDAAEKYGYIIVGSNNSRNVPDRPLAEIIINPRSGSAPSQTWQLDRNPKLKTETFVEA